MIGKDISLLLYLLNRIVDVFYRRGLEYENIDPNLYQFCRKTIEELKVRLLFLLLHGSQ